MESKNKPYELCDLSQERLKENSGGKRKPTLLRMRALMRSNEVQDFKLNSDVVNFLRKDEGLH